MGIGPLDLMDMRLRYLAMDVLQGVDPVLRTYNTLIIACNMCGQPREAMAVYRRMLDAGYSPNATTYNALISAYGKNGQLDKAGTPAQTPLLQWQPQNLISLRLLSFSRSP